MEMFDDDDKQICYCRAKPLHIARQRKQRENGKRKRQVFVYNPEEEIWHEPYMQNLRREFSEESIPCDSKIELPWREIALPTTGMRIRPDISVAPADAEEEAEVADDVDKKRETACMTLPWEELLITEIVPTGPPEKAEMCDSLLEIPWSDLALEKPMVIQPPRKEKPCPPDDIEIPWETIRVPRNIIIEPEKRKRHPSSGRPPRAYGEPTCLTCEVPCCVKMRKDAPNIKTVNPIRAAT